jgi:hypothetical protein
MHAALAVIILAQENAYPVPVPVPVMEGVTTALVAFIFACVIFPHLVKNKTQFYGAFVAVIVIILLHSLNTMIGSVGFQVFAGALTGILQACAMVLLFLAAGGITLKQLGQEMSRAYEVIRRGEDEKTVIVPLTGEMPRPRKQSEASAAAVRDLDNEIEENRIDLPPSAGWPAKPQTPGGGDEPRGSEMPPPRRQPPAAPGDSSSIPLE